MAVTVNIAREGVEIAWEPGEYVGPVKVRAVNIVNADVGVAKSENDGKAFLTWPPGTYVDAVTVIADDGSEQEIDSGVIAVTVGE